MDLIPTPGAKDFAATLEWAPDGLSFGLKDSVRTPLDIILIETFEAYAYCVLQF
jgi:hypothetical protein